MNVPPSGSALPYEDEVDLREILLVLWRQRWMIILITLAAVLASVLASVVLPPVYRVEALVELERVDTKAPQQNEGKAILESQALLTTALEQLAIPADPRSFKARGEVIKDTEYLRFSLEGQDPPQVAAVAGKMVALFIEQRNKVYEERRAPLEKELHKISRELEQSSTDREKINELIAGLEKAPLSQVEQKLYALQLAQLQGIQAQEKVGLTGQYLSLQDKLAAMHPAKIVDDLSEPEKVRPRLLLNAAVALVLGLMAGIFLALGRNWLAGPSQK
ncbi:Wzz/FepE/Etk N-terminal domain-containing protein [Neomoorella mulderi]|uniref:Cryptic autophosphorylating protein tyrosine kinase Etk n=1 Tax=Moorella mulderi DSM 14980 TaxID=1122241 RepID=A0A151AYM8_9FIRM|nr:Wzz/FepE/Etk N-terminal domain-containing protein [Moorella mulderi]KYH32764.1 cryptic autophosphorylating protein tyrosine kinase Etk [Moorella mulderi DSM 14980]